MLNAKTREWMAANGFNPQLINGEGIHQDSALILACRRAELKIVEDLLEAGADLNLRNMDGTDALWAACVADAYGIADLLLQKGANIDNQNDNGASVLMYAASNGRSEWVDYLLQAGADISLLSLDGFSALDLASTITILRTLKKAEQEKSAGGVVKTNSGATV
jgi:ankyrin repeat protein